MDWKNTLLKYQKEDYVVQNEHKKEIVAAFKEMVLEVETEEEFSKYMSNIVLFTEMLFYIIKGR